MAFLCFLERVNYEKNILSYLEETTLNFPSKIIFADNVREITYENFLKEAKWWEHHYLKTILKIIQLLYLLIRLLIVYQVCLESYIVGILCNNRYTNAY